MAFDQAEGKEEVIEVHFDLPKMDSKLIEALKLTMSPSEED
jgi:hypothetical protein